MRVDLHTHTNASDGNLLPGELIFQAEQAGVEMLAITDHDSVAAYSQLETKKNISVQLIKGIEISSRWKKMGVHIVGLNVDINNAGLKAAIKKQQKIRTTRAKLIADKLQSQGFENVLEGTYKIAGDAAIGRLHFAHYLIAIGAVKNYNAAFKKYLGDNKLGEAKNEWETMSQAIQWIDGSGGKAVLAHPAKYKLTHAKMEQLIADFAAAGGHAIEVVSGLQTQEISQRLAKLAEQYHLLASSGSDFHRPGQSWAALGAQSELPKTCRPVWEEWIQ
ncbi:MAG: PHP domain-containing protein [Pseudomonadota bacterium]|nr:PHP domain-containing protein [Pseudomonadota bacterium]